MPDLYKLVASLTWPANVLLAGIWSVGAMSSLTPTVFWERVAFIPTIGELAENEGGAILEEIKGAQVNFHNWAEWCSPHEVEGVDGNSTVFRSLGVELSGKRKRELKRFLYSMSLWNNNSTVLQQEVTRCCLIPQLIASGQEHILDDLMRVNRACRRIQVSSFHRLSFFTWQPGGTVRLKRR